MFKTTKAALSALLLLACTVTAAGQGAGGHAPAQTQGADEQLKSKVISKPAPPYPAVAKAARASGQVVVEITVDESGRVVEAQAVSGHPLLRHAAVEAARKATFSPTLAEGRPVKVSGKITYNFTLDLGAAAGFDDAGKLNALYNLHDLSDEGTAECPSAEFVGVIAAVRRGGGRIAALVLDAESNERLEISLGAKLYEDLTADAQKKIGDLLAQGRRVGVRVRDCRQTGGAIFAKDILSEPQEEDK